MYKLGFEGLGEYLCKTAWPGRVFDEYIKTTVSIPLCYSFTFYFPFFLS